MCRLWVGTLVSAALPQDLASHLHTQTSATLVALVPLGEVSWRFVFFLDINKISLWACGSICKSPLACASGSLWLGCLKAAFPACRNVNSFLLNSLKRFLRSSFTYVLYYSCFCFSWFILSSHNLPLSPSLTSLTESWHFLIYCSKFF